jgi:probable F420-dependent oxidoreductase
MSAGVPQRKEIAVRVETILLNLETEQYAGTGHQVMSLANIAAAARRVEALGFDGATIPEAGHDPFLPVAVAAEHTQHITFGTNVAIAFPRSPMVTAQVAWDLQQLSGGRFLLGLGTQVKGHNERRYCAPWMAAPGPRLREYVLSLKAMFASFANPRKPTYFEGEHYKFTLMPPFFNPGPIDYPAPPIHIAAVNKYMCRLAGEMCDGLRLHPIATFKYTAEVIRPAIERGTRKAGRKLSDVDIVGAPFLAIGKNGQEITAAKNALRQRISFYASTRTYHSVLDFHGWVDVGLELHELSLKGKWQEMPRLITDEMLEEWALIGTPDRLAALIHERCGDVFSSIMLDLPLPVREDEAAVRALIQALH